MSRQIENLHYLTISEASQLIASGELSSLTLTNHILDRIDTLDGKLHAYATVMKDQALAAAQKADLEIAEGRYRGPLHGIPIAVKDLCYTRGVRTMGGMAVFADHVPDYDATVVSRLAEAGAVLTGKLNLTEGAVIGYHPDFAIPRNPWSIERWAGASSSGSGVAAAAGMAFATLGSDTGGSIRFPSACCGLVGLKPTWGRVSRYGVIPLAESLDHVGPLARCTKDAAIMFEAIAGVDGNDPTSLPAPVANIVESITAGIAGLRIGIDKKDMETHCQPEVSAGVVAGAEILASLGAEIVDINLPNPDDFLPAWSDIILAETALAHVDTFPSRRDDYGPYLRNWLEAGSPINGMDYARANNLRNACKAVYSGLFESVDLLLIPSMPDLPPIFSEESLYGTMPDFDFGAVRYTAPFDFTGAPTLSLPCGMTAQGLPLSLQLVGRHEDEQLLCQAGHAFEQVTNWHQLHPAL
jgi:amidase